jgi:hypothetical protein
MARIDECQVTNEWNDITTYSYFRLALRVQADKWLSSIVRHLQLTAAQKHGLASDQFLKQNLLLSQMTSSSLTVWPSFCIDQMRIPGCFSHDWRSSSMF